MIDRNLSCLLLLFGLLGCDESVEHAEAEPPKMEELAKAFSARDPLKEARERISEERFQVYSAMGAAHYYPGIDILVGYYISWHYSSTMLDETSDAIESEEHEAYIEAASQFASAFNREMVSGMRDRGLIPRTSEIELVAEGWSAGDGFFETTPKLIDSISELSGGDRYWPIVIKYPSSEQKAVDELSSGLAAAGFSNVLLDPKNEG